MAEWWFDNSGQNLLAGVVPDDVDVNNDNPIRLPDDYILDFLRRIPAARESFNRLYPQMLPEEQERLARIAGNAQLMRRPEKEQSDAFQRSLNVAGVRSTGPNGGRRIGGNR